MSIETRVYTSGEIYTLGRLDHALALRKNLEELLKVGIREKRVFLTDPEADKFYAKDPPLIEQRIPITTDLMMGIYRTIWGLQADALASGLNKEVLDIVEKYPTANI